MLQLLPGARLCHPDKIADDVVPAGINPEGPGERVRLPAQLVDIIDHIPGAVDFRTAKAVSVIPFLDQVKLVGALVSFCHGLDFALGKAEPFVGLCICDGIHLQVVQPGEDAL